MLPHNGFLRWIGYATAFCALIGSLWGGKLVLDTTYAGAADTSKKFDSLQLFLLKKDLRELKKERGELEQEKEHRSLTKYEKTRLKELDEEITGLERDVKGTK